MYRIFKEAEITHVLLPIMGALLALMLVLHLTRDKQATPLEAALRKFKFGSIAYGIVIFLLLLCLPATGIYEFLTPQRIESLAEAVEYQRDLGMDLDRLREIFYWAFFNTIFWVWGVFNFLKELAAESTKKST